ncbi:MAG: DUF1343 domain-containing protein [Planctomycetota bacterium]
MSAQPSHALRRVRAGFAAAALAATASCSGGGEPAVNASEPGEARAVRLGIDVLLSQRIELVEGKRVGLITNPSGVDHKLVPTADRLARDERIELVQLFGPEHGIRGEVNAGDEVDDEVDPVTGLPVESLYGSSKRPSAEALARIDVLLFDIQDVGSRTYTYVSTLGEALYAAAEAGVQVVVLDRPNPLGGELVEGPIREEQWKSFISWGPVPVVHGMTAGELALLFNEELEIGADVEVVPVGGWSRSMQWEDTGLTWVQTSPHIPHPLQAHVYVATGMIGGVTENVNEGVGYTIPFETLAADFVDARDFARALSAARLPGVRFQPIAYLPYYGRHEGQPMRGVRLILSDRRAFRPLRTALTAMVALEDLYPGKALYKDGRPFAIHWGNEHILERIRAGGSVAGIEAEWADELERFRESRKRFLLYD